MVLSGVWINFHSHEIHFLQTNRIYTLNAILCLNYLNQNTNDQITTIIVEMDTNDIIIDIITSFHRSKYKYSDTYHKS